MKALAYSLKLAKMTISGKHTAAVISILDDWVTGSLKLGTTPGGGAPEGRSQILEMLSMFLWGEGNSREEEYI